MSPGSEYTCQSGSMRSHGLNASPDSGAVCQLGTIMTHQPGELSSSPSSEQPSGTDHQPGMECAHLPDGSEPSPGLVYARQSGMDPMNSTRDSVPSPGWGSTEVRGESGDEQWRGHRTQPTGEGVIPHPVGRRRGRPRKLPPSEAAGSANDSEPDGGHNAESVLSRAGEYSNSGELHKEFLAVLRTVRGREEGDLSGRARPSCKGINVLQKLLRAADDLAVEEFQKGEPSLWRLNCLVYASAELVSRRTRRTFAGTTEKQTSLKRKEADVGHLRKVIGWLEAETARRKVGTRRTSR